MTETECKLGAGANDITNEAAEVDEETLRIFILGGFSIQKGQCRQEYVGMTGVWGVVLLKDSRWYLAFLMHLSV